MLLKDPQRQVRKKFNIKNDNFYIKLRYCPNGTRAYFTAATCAISLFKILSIALDLDYLISKFKVKNTPPQFLSLLRTNLIERLEINLNKDSNKIIL